MASTFGSKSKSFMTMSIPPRDEPSTGGKLRDRNTEDSWALLEDLALYENESWNDPRDFAKPVKAISLPQDVPSTSDRHLIELENQVQHLMEAHLAPNQPVQAFVDYASSRTNKVEGNSIACVNAVSVNDLEKEAPRKKGIKSPSKLLSQTSLKEQNRKPSFPEHVHFVNSIISLKKENAPEEEEIMESSVTKDNYRNIMVKKEEGVEKRMEESDEDIKDEETKEETEEEEEDDPEYFDIPPTIEELSYHEWILKNPRPPWVNAKIKTRDLDNMKISCIVG
ncbi:hypothetical protein Tco_0444826 [Tanacetum coccineum]